MRPKILVCAVLLGAGMAISLKAQTHPGAGTTAFPFLSEHYDIRALGMGNASIGMPNDLLGVLGNVGALGFTRKRQAMLGYRPIFVDLGVAGVPLAFAAPLDRAEGTPFVVAAHIVPFKHGSVEEITIEKTSTGIIWRSYSISGGVSFAALTLDGLGVGVTLKGIYDRMDGGENHFSSDGIALDAGAQYRILRNRFVCGIAVSNLGFVRDPFSQESDVPTLPITVAAGISYALAATPTSRMALDIVKRRGDFLTYSPGLEVDVYKNLLLARAGYSFSHRDLREAVAFLQGESDEAYQKTSWSSFTFGVGIVPTLVGMDMQLGMAYETRVDGLPPTFAVSALLGF